MRLTDDRGLVISTSSEFATSAYNEGMALMLSAWPGADVRLDEAIAADPDFALAHAARARLHAISVESQAAHAAVEQAQRLVALRGSERERSHVDVIALAVTGRSEAALTRCLEHLEHWPRDALIMSLPLGAFGLYAFSGMVDHDQARVDLVERYAAQFAPDDWWFSTYRGWALAENGEVKRARPMLERAVEQRRENANGVHALAHAMHEGGEGDDADAMIREWLPSYDRSGLLHGHISWHAALVALERGDVTEALRVYDGQVHSSASKGMAINIVSDAASLLWRIGAYGHEVPAGAWNDLDRYAATKFPKAGHAFTDIHMMMVEAMTNDRGALQQRLATLDALAAKGRLSAGVVVPTIGRALQAFADGDNRQTISLLEPVRHEVARIGGSGAQREVIEDTLVVAYMRAGEATKARRLLDVRLHRRPSPRDARWREDLAA